MTVVNLYYKMQELKKELDLNVPVGALSMKKTFQKHKFEQLHDSDNEISPEHVVHVGLRHEDSPEIYISGGII